MAQSENKGISKEKFLELMEPHRDEFFRYILRQAWDASKAEDIFASAVLAGFENRHKFQPGTNFRAWMYRIITNKCYVANRETSRTFDSLDEQTKEIPASEGEPVYEDLLENPARVMEECGEELHHAFKKLSEAERNCILLRGIEKFSYKEIAEILNMPAGTVMTHLSRGRAKLRKELTEYAEERGVFRGRKTM